MHAGLSAVLRKIKSLHFVDVLVVLLLLDLVDFGGRVVVFGHPDVLSVGPEHARLLIGLHRSLVGRRSSFLNHHFNVSI